MEGVAQWEDGDGKSCYVCGEWVRRIDSVGLQRQQFDVWLSFSGMLA